MKTINTLWATGLSLFLFFCTAAGLQADSARVWEIDKDHANIYFVIDHIFAKIGGRFQDFTVKAEIDPNNLEKGSFFCEIKTASIHTDQAQRDQHLRSADFFDAAQYPLIRFTSTSIQKEQESLYMVRGELEIKGKKYALTVPFRLNPPQKHPMMPDKEVLGLNGSISVDRLALGIGDGSFYKKGILGKETDILITFEMLADVPKK